MTKSEISRKISHKFKLSKSDADKVLNTITDGLFKAVSSGARVEIRGFGSFYTKQCNSYTGRNPRTGEKVEVEAKRLPYFRQGKEIKSVFKKMSERESD